MRASSWGVACGHASLACGSAGLRGSPTELGLPRCNYWIFPGGNDHNATHAAWVKDKEQPFNGVFLSFPSAKDPTWESRFPGKSTAVCVAEMPWEWVQAFAEKRVRHRGEEYDAMKARLVERLVALVVTRAPQVADRVEYTELGTPASSECVVEAERGPRHCLGVAVHAGGSLQ